jgi:hypothetical protein
MRTDRVRDLLEASGVEEHGAGRDVPACTIGEFGPWRSLASALAWGARGPGFKSRRPDQIPQRLTDTTFPSSGVLESNWSPKWTPAFAHASRHRIKVLLRSGSLPPIKTRHFRQIEPNPFIPEGELMSGSRNFPTSNPTNRGQKPDKAGVDALVACRLQLRAKIWRAVLNGKLPEPSAKPGVESSRDRR